MSKGIDWASAPEGYPIWVESKLSCEPSGWHCLDAEGSFRDRNGERWLSWQVKAGECVPHYKPEWDGEGLPPVGVRIEIAHKDAQPDWARPGFYETKIIAMGEQLMILEADGSGCEKVGKISAYHFRPIRTAEQIAKAQRAKACDEIYGVLCSPGIRPSNRSDMAEALYDAGYRKQVAP